MSHRPMEADIYPWVALQGVVWLAPAVAAPIHRAPLLQGALGNAIPISPIRMVQQLTSPIQMKAPPVPITLRARLEFLPHPLLVPL